jgi:cell volume regulation protein A
VFQRGILLFHDAAAWLSQIVMFVMLGLLSFPSRLMSVSWQALAIAAVLILVARPVAVVLSLCPFRFFNWREQTLLSWVGLKGAVPITLATFPLLLDVPQAGLLFDVVFFVVVLSAVIQGWSLPLLARWLKLDIPPTEGSPVTLELSSLRHVEGDIVDYTVGVASRAAGRLVRDLPLPEGVVIALVARDPQIIPPHGSTRIEAGDHVVLVMRPGARPLVNQVFAANETTRGNLPQRIEFPLRANTTVGLLEEMYGIKMNAPPDSTLDDAIRQRLGDEPPAVGQIVHYGQIGLRVRSLTGVGRIEQVGMIVVPEDEAEPL